MSSDLLDAEEAADYLRVHRMTIAGWVTRGKLRPARGKGKGHGKQRFTVRELNRFLKEEGGDRWWQG